MTDQDTRSAVEQALAAAGAEFTNALRDVGLRIVATTALGQVIAGLPDAARGMIDKLSDADRYTLAGAVGALHEIVVDTLPETKLADAQHEQTPPAEAESYRTASLFATAYRDDQPRLQRQLADDALTHDQLHRTRIACRLLMTSVEALMPQAADQ